MAADVEIRVEGEGELDIIGRGSFGSEHQLRQALDDIADRIENYARTLAPLGESGDLKAHPTDRSDRSGIVTAVSSIGGGTSVRGTGGRFTAATTELPGREVSHIEITVAKNPEHAIFVHQGTGIFGPHNSPIVPRRANFLKFEIGGRKFRVKSVKGQPAQPFLTEAYEFVDRTYVPHRVEQLRIEIAALFSK